LPGNLILLNFALVLNFSGSSTSLSILVPLPVAGKEYQHEYGVCNVELVAQSRFISATIKRIYAVADRLQIQCSSTAMTGNTGIYGQIIYEKG
jgi:hypothetical protein